MTASGSKTGSSTRTSVPLGRPTTGYGDELCEGKMMWSPNQSDARPDSSARSATDAMVCLLMANPGGNGRPRNASSPIPWCMFMPYTPISIRRLPAAAGREGQRSRGQGLDPPPRAAEPHPLRIGSLHGARSYGRCWPARTHRLYGWLPECVCRLMASLSCTSTHRSEEDHSCDGDPAHGQQPPVTRFRASPAARRRPLTSLRLSTNRASGGSCTSVAPASAYSLADSTVA